MADIKYQRLTFARRRSIFSVAVSSRSSLWLGPDHLLCVDFNGYSENYKRFYFHDIQAITVRETRRRTIWNAVLLTPIVLSLTGLVICLFSGKSIGAIIAWSIVAAVFIVPCVINTLLGPTCTTQLRTAVQTEDLPSLARVRKTRKVLAKIRPLITGAQGGELPPDVISSWMRDAATASPEKTAENPTPSVIS